MIDFKRKDLYKREETRKGLFLNKKLVTEREQMEQENNAQMGIGMETSGTLEAGEFLGGDSIALGDLGDDDGDGLGSSSVGDYGGGGDRSGVQHDMEWRKDGQPMLTFFMAFPYLIKYIFTDMVKDFPRKMEWKSIIKAYNVGNMVSITLALLEILIGIENIFSPYFQLTVGVITYGITWTILHYVYQEDVYLIQFLKRFKKEEEKEEVEAFGFSEAEDYEETGEVEILDLDLRVELTEDMREEEEEDEEVEGEEFEADNRLALAASSISTVSNEEFAQDLLDVFARNARYQGTEIGGRVDLIKSFSEYLIQNDSSFGKWKRPKERGVEYNNIAYSLFKGLSQIEQQFGKYVEDIDDEDDKMVIVDMKKSPLLYRIELELPSYFGLKKLQRQIKVIEDVLRKAEDDTEVSVIMTSFRGNIVFKILRLDSKQLVSLGDILRFNDEDKGFVGMEAYDNPKYGLPVLIGLQNNEFPFVLDMEDNTSGVIVGGSGSGKSWTTFEIMMNMVTTNDYNNINFIVLDAKNAPFWNSFARLPHVLGYHTDPLEYIEVLEEVEAERLRRQQLLNDLNEEDIKGYRESLRSEGNYEKMKEVPLLYVIIDEITATMTELKNTDEELFKTMSNLLGIISQKGRSAGVRILAIGQRSTYDSIPKSLMANSSFKFGMKMNVANDFVTLLGDDVKQYSYPNTTGMGLISVEGVMDMHMIKTLTVGGTNNRQMLMLVRVLAFEWVRRSYGLEDFNQLPKGMEFKHAFNRNKYYSQSIQEMSEGRILAPATVNEGYEVILDASDYEKKPGHKIQRAIAQEENRIEQNRIRLEKLAVENEPEEMKREIHPEDDVIGEENTLFNSKKEDDTGDLEGLDWGNLRNLLNKSTDTVEKVKEEETVNLQKVSEEENTAFLEKERGPEEEITKSKIELEGENEEEEDWKIPDLTETVKIQKEDKPQIEGVESIETDFLKEIDVINKQQEEEKEEEEDRAPAMSLMEILGEGPDNSEVGSEVLGEQGSDNGSISSEKRGKGGCIAGEINKHMEIEKVHSIVHTEVPEKVLEEFTIQNEFVIETDYVEMNESKIRDNNTTGKTEQKRKEIAEQKRKLEEERLQFEKEREAFEREKREATQTSKQPESILTEEKNLGEWKQEKAKPVEYVKTEVQSLPKESLPKEVEVDYIADIAHKKDEIELPVKQYVAKYGKAVGFNVYMSKEELESVYSKETITKALNMIAIVETKDSYMTRL